MKTLTRILFVLSCLTIGTVPLAAQLIWEENFNYSTGVLADSAFVRTNVSGGKWQWIIGNNPPIYVTSGNLTYGGYPSSGLGNKTTIVGLVGGPSAEDVERSINVQIPGSKIYYAFLVRLSDTTKLRPPTHAFGEYFIALHSTAASNTNSYVARVDCKKGPTGGYVLGIASWTDTTNFVSSKILAKDSTYLVVVRYDINTGSKNNVASIWINPSVSATEPTPDAVSKQIIATGVEEPDSVEFVAIRVQYNTTGGCPDADIDGIRASKSWSTAVLTGVDSYVSDQPSSFALSQNYPNPFNPETKIQYAMKSSGHVTLAIYDLLGHEVMTVVNKELAAGTYSSTIDGSHLTSGVYFYRMQVETGGKELFQSTKTFLLLK